MSTRCQIVVMGDENEKDLNNYEALIYRHSDGYPNGVMPDIMPFIEWWAKGRGMVDSEYFSARFVQYLCNRHDHFTLMFHKEMPLKTSELEEKEMEQFTGTLGHGICKIWHGDIEYVYAIYPTKVVVFDCQSDWGKRKKNINKRVRKLIEVEIGKFNAEEFEKKITKIK